MDLPDKFTFRVPHLKDHQVVLGNLPHGVVLSPDFDGLSVGHDHVVVENIVQGGAEENRGLAPCVFSYVSADGGGPRAGGVGGKDEVPGTGLLHGILGDHPGLHRKAVDDLSRLGGFMGDAPNAVQLFGVDHDAGAGEGHAASGEACASAPGDDGETQALDGQYQWRYLTCPGGPHHGQGRVEPPVRGVGDVGNQVKGIKIDIFPAHNGSQGLEKPSSVR